jgi:hypothetical protein
VTKPAFSLRTKLHTLDVGDIVIFPDDAPMMTATNMERQIRNVICKSPTLAARKFRTARCDTVIARTLMPTLLVERLE